MHASIVMRDALINAWSHGRFMLHLLSDNLIGVDTRSELTICSTSDAFHVEHHWVLVSVDYICGLIPWLVLTLDTENAIACHRNRNGLQII